MQNVTEIPVNDLRPYDKNARVHTDGQINRIADSLRRFGFRSPVVIDGENVLITGHGRVMAARRLWDSGQSIPRLGAGMIPCLRIVGMAEEHVKALRIADNKIAQMSYFDEDQLRALLKELTDSGIEALAMGFSWDEMRALTRDADEALESDPIETPSGPRYDVVKFSCRMTAEERTGATNILKRNAQRFGAVERGEVLVAMCKGYNER